ncbi:hypothetical protein BOTBODRAFT_66283 [Botryobasidium botryosum FD-172 SS1]|uniref:Cyclin-like domain-containing protein n=1 Tax=Botryobasidium botryosum (strain FD-172 SS1) TaxID=930990 RepID=A0A067MEW6_BOTB1|nr:hypothetical protein BOTBODRAFT_66283 [Botryobasidium botryosum FD-172 SS1]
MATDFWASSHFNYWIVDHATVKQAREEDLRYATPREVALLGIFFANVIFRLCKKLDLRQQVIATATVFFRRFYLRSSYCGTDPFFVAAACVYLAAKAEETPIHLKNVVVEARTVFSNEYGIRHFPADHSKLAEMEFYLLEDLDFHLIVFHPYRDLIDLCAQYTTVEIGEEGEVGAEVASDGDRYWGTGKGKWHIAEAAVQTAWFIINDTFRSDLCLIYPPYLIATASVFVACVTHAGTLRKLQAKYTRDNIIPSKGVGVTSIPPPPSAPHVLTQTPQRTFSTPALAARDEMIDFFAGLNISLEVMAKISQEIMSMYALWDSIADSSNDSERREAVRRMRMEEAAIPGGRGIGKVQSDEVVYTERDLVAIIQRMREARDLEEAHPPTGRPMAVNKRLAL